MLNTKIIDYPPETVNSFHIYSYEWVDNLSFTLKPEECLDEPEKYTALVRQMFLQQGDGWDGDGPIELMWIPPFTFTCQQDKNNSKGIVIWHVKQVENGISWILSPVELPFKCFGAR